MRAASGARLDSNNEDTISFMISLKELNALPETKKSKEKRNCGNKNPFARRAATLCSAKGF